MGGKSLRGRWVGPYSALMLAALLLARLAPVAKLISEKHLA